MKNEKALHDLLREVSPKEYLELLRLLNNCYLETVESGVNMDVIYRIQRLEDYFQNLNEIMPNFVETK